MRNDRQETIVTLFLGIIAFTIRYWSSFLTWQSCAWASVSQAPTAALRRGSFRALIIRNGLRLRSQLFFGARRDFRVPRTTHSLDGDVCLRVMGSFVPARFTRFAFPGGSGCFRLLSCCISSFLSCMSFFLRVSARRFQELCMGIIGFSHSFRPPPQPLLLRRYRF
jgi:hypothetical protein